MPIGTFDRTPPLSPLDAGGMDIAAGAEVELVAANPGRVKVTVLNAAAAGTVWLGLGQTAQAGVGLPLGPGGSLSEYVNCAVRVRNTHTSTVRVTWVGFGA